jgi:hypothetical protein
LERPYPENTQYKKGWWSDSCGRAVNLSSKPQYSKKNVNFFFSSTGEYETQYETRKNAP